jgi:hypothetical protein
VGAREEDDKGMEEEAEATEVEDAMTQTTSPDLTNT